MAHSRSKIWIHLIWSTKNRKYLITKDVEKQIFDAIRFQFIEISCPIDRINGMPDHVHALFILHPQKALSEVVKQIKGASSHFINQQNLTETKFSWSPGFNAFSVSESSVDAVRAYIDNQKVHHASKSFSEEIEAFIHLHGLPLI